MSHSKIENKTATTETTTNTQQKKDWRSPKLARLDSKGGTEGKVASIVETTTSGPGS